MQQKLRLTPRKIEKRGLVVDGLLTRALSARAWSSRSCVVLAAVAWALGSVVRLVLKLLHQWWILTPCFLGCRIVFRKDGGIVVEVADVGTLYSRCLRACMLNASSHGTCQDAGKGNGKGERSVV